jgi:hypothetical protein
LTSGRKLASYAGETSSILVLATMRNKLSRVAKKCGMTEAEFLKNVTEINAKAVQANGRAVIKVISRTNMETLIELDGDLADYIQSRLLIN